MYQEDIDRQGRIITEGCSVRVVASCSNHANGWDNTWYGPGMDPYVGDGMVYVVTEISGRGVRFTDGEYGWPAFCLEVTSPAPVKTDKVGQPAEYVRIVQKGELTLLDYGADAELNNTEAMVIKRFDTEYLPGVKETNPHFLLDNGFIIIGSHLEKLAEAPKPAIHKTTLTEKLGRLKSKLRPVPPADPSEEWRIGSRFILQNVTRADMDEVGIPMEFMDREFTITREFPLGDSSWPRLGRSWHCETYIDGHRVTWSVPEGLMTKI